MKVLVTGGGGFLGTAICKELVKRKYQVFNFSRNHYAHLTELGIETRKGNLSDPDSIELALEGIEAVFHVAAIAGVWGRYNDFYTTNTLGTENLVDNCKKLGLKYFIYTSTPSVVFAKDDILLGDESLSFPNKYLTDYAYTKSLAEKKVLSSVSDNFKALAIRPHLIWGPGDPHLFPRLILKAKEGKLKRVGDGDNLVDIIYVDNAAIAHVDAFEKLKIDDSLSGEAYFIGQKEPVNLWDFINKIITLAGEEPVDSSISFSMAYKIGYVMEKFYKLLGIVKPEPPMTRFIATQLAKSHYFSHAKAIRDFGFNPSISTEEGLKIIFDQKKEALKILRPL